MAMADAENGEEKNGNGQKGREKGAGRMSDNGNGYQ
jgi:hypothetical protein